MTKKSKIFFSSDHHFGHENIIKFCNRPYENTSQMAEDFIVKWNSLITPEDTVYYLGDLTLERDHDLVSKLVEKLNGEKILIIGNHDEQFKAHGWVNAGFKSAHTSLKIKYNQVDILLGHNPGHKEKMGERNVLYIHGHSHQNTA